MADIFPSEQEIVGSAVDKRKAEFSTGRALAARSLQLLGVPRQPILKGSKNEPLWPTGLVGSITHTSEICIVAVARESVCGGVGVDVEKCDANVSELAHLIFSSGEAERYMARTGRHRDDTVRRTFSAKESVFKAVFVHLGRFVDFDEVSIEFDDRLQSFIATATDDGKLDELLISGKGGYVFYDDLIVTNFVLPGLL